MLRIDERLFQKSARCHFVCLLSLVALANVAKPFFFILLSPTSVAPPAEGKLVLSAWSSPPLPHGADLITTMESSAMRHAPLRREAPKPFSLMHMRPGRQEAHRVHLPSRR